MSRKKECGHLAKHNMLAVKSVLRTDFTASKQLCPIFSSKSDGSALALPFINDPTEVKMFLAQPLPPRATSGQPPRKIAERIAHARGLQPGNAYPTHHRNVIQHRTPGVGKARIVKH
jgi:hypothetical protein